MREKLLNTSDTPCDLIALASDAIHAPATSPPAESRCGDDKFYSSHPTSPGRELSAPRSPLLEVIERRRLNLKTPGAVPNEVTISEAPGTTYPADQSRGDRNRCDSSGQIQARDDQYGLGSHISDGNARKSRDRKKLVGLSNDVVFTEPLGNKAVDVVLEACLPFPCRRDNHGMLDGKVTEGDSCSHRKSRDGAGVLTKGAEVVALEASQQRAECLTRIDDPAYSAKPVANVCGSRSSDLSRSEVAFEANAGISQRQCQNGQEQKGKAMPLVPYSCTSNERSSTLQKGSLSYKKVRLEVSGSDNNSVLGLSALEDRRGTQAAIPVHHEVRSPANEHEVELVCGEHVETLHSGIEASTKRCFRGTVPRSHGSKKRKKQDMFFSKPSGAQFDELVSCGHLDKHLWMEERKLRRVNNTGMIASSQVLQSNVSHRRTKNRGSSRSRRLLR